MKLSFIYILLLINFLCKSAFSSEKIIQETIIPEDNVEKLLDQKDFDGKKFHIVQEGDTILGISQMYSIDKNFLIELNQIKNEDYIFVGQKIKLTNVMSNEIKAKNKNIPKYHEIVEGENLTEISDRYGLKINDLINLNNLDNPDNIKVGTSLLLIKPTQNIDQKAPSIPKVLNNDLLAPKQYGPLTVKSNKLETVRGRKTLEVTYKNREKLILSLKCETKEIDVRKKGRKWKGWMPVKEKFEERLINDFC